MASDVGKALRTKLLSYTAISSVVGQRMYPDVLKVDATIPAIVYEKISTQREHSLTDATLLAHTRFEVRCYGTSRENANDLAHAIRSSGIAAFRGTSESIQFQGIEFDSGEMYLQEPPSDGNQVHRYITSFDFMVHYKEAS